MPSKQFHVYFNCIFDTTGVPHVFTQASPAVASIAGIPVSIAGLTAVTQNLSGAAVHQVPKVS